MSLHLGRAKGDLLKQAEAVMYPHTHFLHLPGLTRKYLPLIMLNIRQSPSDIILFNPHNRSINIWENRSKKAKWLAQGNRESKEIRACTWGSKYHAFSATMVKKQSIIWTACHTKHCKLKERTSPAPYICASQEEGAKISWREKEARQKRVCSTGKDATHLWCEKPKARLPLGGTELSGKGQEGTFWSDGNVLI